MNRGANEIGTCDYLKACLKWAPRRQRADRKVTAGTGPGVGSNTDADRPTPNYLGQERYVGPIHERNLRTPRALADIRRYSPVS